jgi:hypothetical protein
VSSGGRAVEKHSRPPATSWDGIPHGRAQQRRRCQEKHDAHVFVDDPEQTRPMWRVHDARSIMLCLGRPLKSVGCGRDRGVRTGYSSSEGSLREMPSTIQCLVTGDGN